MENPNTAYKKVTPVRIALEPTKDEFIQSVLGHYGDTRRNLIPDDTLEENLYNYNPEVQNYLKSYQQAKEQPFLDSVGNFVVQTAAEVVGGTIAGFGSLWEAVQNPIVELAGGDADFNNWMLRTGDGIIKSADENFPLYKNNPDKAFDIGDLNWWLKGGVSAFSTLSAMIPAMGIMKGVSALGKAARYSNIAGEVAQVGKLGRVGSKVMKSYDAWKPFTKTTAKNASEAMLMRLGENGRESFQVYEQVHQDSLAEINSLSDAEFDKIKEESGERFKGLNREEFANKVASESAWKTYRIDMANFVFDFIQISAVNKIAKTRMGRLNSGKRSNAILRESAEHTGKTLTPKELSLNKLANFGRAAGAQATEGVEEIINGMAEQEGTKYGKLLSRGIDSSGTLNLQKINRYLHDPHIWEQGFFGVMGGMVFGGTRKLAEKGWRKFKGKTDPESGQLAEIAGRGQEYSKTVAELEKIKEGVNPLTDEAFEGTEEQVEEQKEDAVVSAYQSLGYRTGMTASHVGNVDLLLDWLETPSVKAEMQEKGMTEKQYNTLFNSIIEVEGLYKDYKHKIDQTVNANDAVKSILLSRVLNSKISNNKINDYITKNDTKFNELLENDEVFKSLTEEEQSSYLRALENVTNFHAAEAIREQSQEVSKDYKSLDKIFQEHSKQYAKKLEDSVDKESLNTDMALVANMVKKGINKRLGHLSVSKQLLNFSKDQYQKEVASLINDNTNAKTIKEDLEEGKKLADKELIEKTTSELVSIDENTEDYETKIDEIRDNFVKESGLSVENAEKQLGFEKKKQALEKRKKAKEETTTTEEKDSAVEDEVIVPKVFKTPSYQKALEDFVQNGGKIEDFQEVVNQKEKDLATNLSENIIDFGLYESYSNDLKQGLAKLLNKEIQEDNKEDNSTTLNEEVVDQRDDELNISIFDLYKINFNRDPETGNIIIESEDKAEIYKTVTNLTPGDKVRLRIAKNRQDFPDEKSFREFSRQTSVKNVPIVIESTNGVRIGFVNSLSYLEKELNLLTKLEGSTDEDIKNFIEVLNTFYLNKDISNLSALEDSALFSSLILNKDSISLNNEELQTEIDHLYAILNYKQKNFQGININSIRNTLDEWYFKIQRDYNTSAKVREHLITKNNKEIITEITSRSTGTLVKAVNKEGEVFSTPISEVFEEDIPILITDKDSSIRITNHETGKSIQNVKGFKNNLYILHSDNFGEFPIPVFQTKVNKNSKYQETLHKHLPDLFKTVINNLNNNNGFNKEAISKISQAVIMLDEAGNSGDSFQFHSKGNVGARAEIVLRSGDNAGRYTLYVNNNGKFTVYKKELGSKDKATATELGVNDFISLLTRNVSFKTMQESGNNKFTDSLTGVEYNSYSDYLRQTDAISTDTGLVVYRDSKGKDTYIGNKTVKTVNNSESGYPLTVHVGISSLTAKSKTSPQSDNTIKENLEEFKNGEFSNLYKAAKLYGVTFQEEIVENPEEEFGEEGKTVNAAFIQAKNTVVFTRRFLNSNRKQELLTHEAIHGIIFNQFRSGKYKELNQELELFNSELVSYVKENRKSINKLVEDLEFSDIDTNYVNQILNILSDENTAPEEILTYGLANKAFATLLNNIKSTKKKSFYENRNSFWDRLLKIVAKGLKKIIKGKSKLDELIQITNNVLYKDNSFNIESTEEYRDYLLKLAEYKQHKEVFPLTKEGTILENIKSTKFNKTNVEKEVGKDVNKYWYVLNNGITIEQAAENIASTEMLDESEVRDIIIDILNTGTPKTYRNSILGEKPSPPNISQNTPKIENNQYKLFDTLSERKEKLNNEFKDFSLGFNNSEDLFNHYFKSDTGKTTTKDLLEKLKPNVNPKVLPLVEKLSKVNFNISIIPTATGKEHKDTYMYYSPVNRTITIPKSSVLEDTPNFFLSSLLHEIVHGYSLDQYYDNVEFKKFTDKIFKFSKNNARNKNHYGFTEPVEFIAEIYTNPSFAEELKNIKFIEDSEGKIQKPNPSVLAKFIEYLRDLIFGKPTNTKKEANVYDSYSEILEDLISFQNKNSNVINKFNEDHKILTPVDNSKILFDTLSEEFFEDVPNDVIKSFKNLQKWGLISKKPVSLKSTGEVVFTIPKVKKDLRVPNYKAEYVIDLAKTSKLRDLSKKFNWLNVNTTEKSTYVTIDKRKAKQITLFDVLDDEQVNFNLRIVNSLNKIKKVRETIRLNTKDKPYIEKNLRKTLAATVPSAQIDLIFDKMREKGLKEISTQDLINSIENENVFNVEVKISKEPLEDYDMVDTTGEGNFAPVEFEPDTDIEFIEDEEGRIIDSKIVLSEKGKKQIEERENKRKPTSHYNNLTVPGGTNYTENEILTPDIVPSIKGHAQFATENGIGWFRSDDKAGEYEGFSTKDIGEYGEGLYEVPKYKNINSKTRRVLELQSDLFQKGRNKKKLAKEINLKYKEKNYFKTYTIKGLEAGYRISDKEGNEVFFTSNENEANDKLEILNKEINPFDKQNQFLQLLNKNNKWVKFFIETIIQDSYKKGYEKVLFPKGETAAKIEGHQTLEEFKKQKENRIKEIEKRNKTGAIKVIEEDGEWLGAYDGKSFTVRGYDSKEEILEFMKEKENREIETLKKELADVESGQTQLSNIAKFYEETITNILNKLYNVKQITDEYGNKWNEVTITPENSGQILFDSLEEPTFNPMIQNLINLGLVTKADSQTGKPC